MRRTPRPGESWRVRRRRRCNPHRRRLYPIAGRSIRRWQHGASDPSVVCTQPTASVADACRKPGSHGPTTTCRASSSCTVPAFFGTDEATRDQPHDRQRAEKLVVAEFDDHPDFLRGLDNPTAGFAIAACTPCRAIHPRTRHVVTPTPSLNSRLFQNAIDLQRCLKSSPNFTRSAPPASFRPCSSARSTKA